MNARVDTKKKKIDYGNAWEEARGLIWRSRARLSVGLSLMRILVPVFGVAFVAMIAALLLGELVVPGANRERDYIYDQQIQRVRPRVVTDAAGLADAGRVILPGVGAAPEAMRRLRAQGLVEPLRALQAPLLGICLGMQLLYERSEEGEVECLGLLSGVVHRLPPAPGIRVPHMGWNTLRAMRPSPLLDGVALAERALKQPNLRVLLMSGFAEQLDRARELKSKQVAVLSKPFTLEDVRASVRKLLG